MCQSGQPPLRLVSANGTVYRHNLCPFLSTSETVAEHSETEEFHKEAAQKLSYFCTIPKTGSCSTTLTSGVQIKIRGVNQIESNESYDKCLNQGALPICSSTPEVTATDVGDAEQKHFNQSYKDTGDDFVGCVGEFTNNGTASMIPPSTTTRSANNSYLIPLANRSFKDVNNSLVYPPPPPPSPGDSLLISPNTQAATVSRALEGVQNVLSQKGKHQCLNIDHTEGCKLPQDSTDGITADSDQPVSSPMSRQEDITSLHMLECPRPLPVCVKLDEDTKPTYISKTIVFEPSRESSKKAGHKFPAVSTPALTPPMITHLVQPSVLEDLVSDACRHVYMSSAYLCVVLCLF